MSKKRLQYGTVHFDPGDGWYYYDESPSMRYVKWPQVAPEYPWPSVDWEMGYSMHQKVIVEPWQRSIRYDEDGRTHY